MQIQPFGTIPKSLKSSKVTRSPFENTDLCSQTATSLRRTWHPKGGWPWRGLLDEAGEQKLLSHAPIPEGNDLSENSRQQSQSRGFVLS